MRRAIRLLYWHCRGALRCWRTLKNYFSEAREYNVRVADPEVLIAHLHTVPMGDAEITREMEAKNVKVMLMGPFETFTYRFASNLEIVRISFQTQPSS